MGDRPTELSIVYKPNCVGYVLSTLGLVPDGFYPVQDIEKYLIRVDNPQEAEAVAVIMGTGKTEILSHIALFNPQIPDRVDHRPNTGKAIERGASFHEAIEKIQNEYPDTFRIRYYKRR